MITVPSNGTDPKGMSFRYNDTHPKHCSVYDFDACGRCLLGIRNGGVNDEFAGSFLIGSYMSVSSLCGAASLHLALACSVSLLAMSMAIV